MATHGAAAGGDGSPCLGFRALAGTADLEETESAAATQFLKNVSQTQVESAALGGLVSPLTAGLAGGYFPAGWAMARPDDRMADRDIA